MSPNIKLSFILPAYNCASIVTHTLDSIYNTGLEESEFEVLITDDCSSDNTVQILEDYASSHNNMTVLRQVENHRQGAARNLGLRIARGKYITFVDSDDLVTPQIRTALYDAIEMDVDVYCGTSVSNYVKKPEEFRVFKIVSNLPKGRVYNGFEFCSTVKDFCGNNGTPWGYLFKLDKVIQNGAEFIEDHLFEETEWIAIQFLNADSIYYSDEILYKYLYYPDSISNRNMGINYVVDSNKLAVRMMKLVEKYKDIAPDFVHEWNGFADRNLICKGARILFLIRYKGRDIIQFYHDMGTDDLNYLATHYNGSWERKMIFRHRYFTTVLLVFGCIANAIQRKLRGKGPAKTNFYWS